MTAQSPSAYFTSLLLHTTAATALFLGAWAMKEDKREPAKIIELVAGEGDNYGATEASKLGDPDGVGVDLPSIPAPNMPKIAEPDTPLAPPPEPPSTPEPEPVKPTPAPVTPAPLTEKEKEAGKTKAPPKEPNFAKDIKRLAAKREQRRMTEFRREQAAKEARERKAAELAAKRTSYDKFNAEHGNASQNVRKGLRGGVEQGTSMEPGAGGKALTSAEGSLMERYGAFLKLKLRQAHVPPPGVGGSKLSTEVEFFLAADGTLSRMKVVRSSGNPEFDASVLEAFRQVRSVGPRPDGQSDMSKLRFNAEDDE